VDVIGPQQAELIQNADQIINVLGIPERDHLAVGMRSLARRYYAEARRSLADALRDDPDNAHTRYYLALAQLDGKRPRVHRSGWIDEICGHLGGVGKLPRARALTALVRDDHGLHWRRRDRLPAGLVELIETVAPSCAAEIVFHVPAPESHVWLALERRALREEKG
jgi:hypothetical protein